MGKIEFLAYLPPIQTAITFDGQGDGGRVKLDVSRDSANALLEIQKMAGKRLKVCIEEDASDYFDEEEP